MRIATCANEAAGASIRASSVTIAILFMANSILQGSWVSGISVASRLVEGFNVLRSRSLRVLLSLHPQFFYRP
jgi:hypothetical protein